MSLRTRLAVCTAIAVAGVATAGSLATYFVQRDALYEQLDDFLREQAANAVVQAAPGQPVRVRLPRAPLGGPTAIAQVVRAPGYPAPRPDDARLPITQRTRAVAGRTQRPFFETASARRVRVRIFTTSPVRGLAVQFARPTQELDETLHRLELILLATGAVGVVVAAAMGLGIARAALVPVRRLTDATTHITATRDLSRHVPAGSRDELGRLATDFNEMVAALERADAAQRQLIADASHELRTPVTSLRTNLEVLRTIDELPRGERDRLLADLVDEAEGLAALVGDLVELARDGERPEAVEEVRLDLLAAEVVERARRRADDVEIRTRLSETLVAGAPARLERAVSNVVDNAVKWSPPGGVVEVTVADGELSVRDHGPGIEEADLPHIFERFYRAPAARSMPGTGLGLAIVHAVAQSHGGSATAEAARGGGTVVRLRLPLVDDAPARSATRISAT